MASPISIDSRDVLLAIDLQADFVPGGALAVDGGDEIVPLLNRLANRFEHVVVTQDWRPPGHASFASTHEGAKPFETKRLEFGDQTLWHDHCVQGTPGAELHPDLAVDLAFLILLKARGVKRVFACGLATDFCIAHSALDARGEGFATFVIEDACRAIDANNSLAEAWARMNAAEVWRIQSAEILGPSR